MMEVGVDAEVKIGAVEMEVDVDDATPPIEAVDVVDAMAMEELRKEV